MKHYDMVDAVPQLRAALAGMETETAFTVSEDWPRRFPTGPSITIQEITNSGTYNAVVDELAWQLDLWADSKDVIRILAAGVDRALTGIGLRRTYAGPILWQEDGTVHYRKTFRYGRRVDKRSMRLID